VGKYARNPPLLAMHTSFSRRLIDPFWQMIVLIEQGRESEEPNDGGDPEILAGDPARLRSDVLWCKQRLHVEVSPEKVGCWL